MPMPAATAGGTATAGGAGGGAADAGYACLADGGVVGGWSGSGNPCLCPTDGGIPWDLPNEGCPCSYPQPVQCNGNRYASCFMRPSPYAYRWSIIDCPTACVPPGDGGSGACL